MLSIVQLKGGPSLASYSLEPHLLYVSYMISVQKKLHKSLCSVLFTMSLFLQVGHTEPPECVHDNSGACSDKDVPLQLRESTETGLRK